MGEVHSGVSFPKLLLQIRWLLLWRAFWPETPCSSGPESFPRSTPETCGSASPWCQHPLINNNNNKNKYRKSVEQRERNEHTKKNNKQSNRIQSKQVCIWGKIFSHPKLNPQWPLFRWSRDRQSRSHLQRLARCPWWRWRPPACRPRRYPAPAPPRASGRRTARSEPWAGSAGWSPHSASHRASLPGCTGTGWLWIQQENVFTYFSSLHWPTNKRKCYQSIRVHRKERNILKDSAAQC